MVLKGLTPLGMFLIANTPIPSIFDGRRRQ
jgi:hypothetical protein